jgi:hypothetical protein
MSTKDGKNHTEKKWFLGTILKYAFLGEVHESEIKKHYEKEPETAESKKIREERLQLKRLLKNAVAVHPNSSHESDILKNKEKNSD